MRPSAAALALVPLAALASPAPPATHVRDESHMHMHSGPMSEINETEILQWHLPTPPSYWSIDIEDRDPNVARYPALIALHASFMSLAFFVALPAGMLLPSLPPLIHLPLTPQHDIQASLSALLDIPIMAWPWPHFTPSQPLAVLPAASTENSLLICKLFLL